MSMTTTQIANLIAANGYTDVATMNADKRTRSAIPLAYLTGNIIYPSGLLMRMPDGTFGGTLADAMQGGAKLADGVTPVPSALQDGLRRFLGGIMDSRAVNLDTTNAAIATQASAVLTGCVQAGLLTSDQVTAVYTLGGGLLVPDTVSQADFDAGVAINTLNAAKTQRQKDFQVWYNEQIGAIMRATDAASMPVVPEAGS